MRPRGRIQPRRRRVDHAFPSPNLCPIRTNRSKSERSLAGLVALRGVGAFAHRGSPVGREGIIMKRRWLSVEEAAAYLGISRDTVYKWIERKRMPAHKVGRLWKFQAEDIDTWVREGRAASGKKRRGRSA